MSKVAAANVEMQPVVLTDDVVAMADYMRSPDGALWSSAGLPIFVKGAASKVTTPSPRN